MEISLETLAKLRKEKTVTVTIEDDLYGDFKVKQSPDEFIIEATGCRLEIERPCGGICALLTAFEAFSEILRNWPEN